jgi:hypothetical protein
MAYIVEIAKQHVLLWGLGVFLAGILVGVLVKGLPTLSSHFWYWYLWAVVSTATMLWLVTSIWDTVPGITTSPVAERDGIGLVCILGTIGGLIRWMHRLFESQDKNLGLDSFLWPLEGAALSLIVVLLLRAGVVSSAADQGKAVNWLGLYAIAGLTGLFAKEAVAKLAEVFTALLGTK